MSKLIKINEEYKQWISELSERFRISQLRASVNVNAEMLSFYWSLGEDIVKLQAENKWGKNFFNNLSLDLQNEFPNVKGFSPRNLRYMKSFFILYSQLFENLPQAGAKSVAINCVENLPQAGAKSEIINCIENLPQAGANLFAIPWGHHKYIIDRYSNNLPKAFFFVQKTIENGWSRSMLLNFLNTDLYERQSKAITNFRQTLPAIKSELAQQITKDPYNFDFISLTENYKEKELKDALIDNITRFLMELGTGFAYMGREYRLQIGKKEQFIDLLFYNTTLHCYIVAEVKISEFDPSYLGQLSTYVVAVNHMLRKDGDNETIGLLICKTKDNIFAQYSLEGYNLPLGISEYELSNLLPANFKGTLPSIEDIENELKDDFNG
jgi:predicted nuclease of restriction endonuclease-like (RecB) superfamily